MSTNDIAVPQPAIKRRKGKAVPPIPYLARNPFVVVLGAEPHLAAERLRVVAAEGQQRCVEFTANRFVAAKRYAEIMRKTARATGCPVLHVPFRGTEQAMADVADLIVIAPSGVGNRVWVIPRDGDAYSVHLPDIPLPACQLTAQLLLLGVIELTNTHRARPDVRLTPAFRKRLKRYQAAPVTPASATVH